MLLDLRGIMDNPGSEVSFDYEPDMDDVPFGSINKIKESPRAIGKVTNKAGLIKLTANVDAICECSCARCVSDFEFPLHMQVGAYLTEEFENESETDCYIIKNDRIDLDEVIISELLLDIDERILCRDDCAGLCQICGANLNDGPCGCKKEIDPRLAKLQELLDTKIGGEINGSTKE
jgi:uncharacterized protein